MTGIRKPNISVLGSYSATAHEQEIAYALGKGLANLNVNIISGGQKGVMLSLCKGAHDNRLKEGGTCSIVGILPNSDFDKANPYIDIVIPTGAGSLQNIIVPMAGDIVLAIGGSAGTLAEISFAWQNGKKIGLLGNTGWANKLANQCLDDRRADTMPFFSSVDLAVEWVKLSLSLKL